MLDNRENIEKAQKKVEKSNAKFLSAFISYNQQRHVKEQNEPVLDSIIDNFQESYSKIVVTNTIKTIKKMINDV